MRTFVVAALAALTLSACQDPSGAGLGLIDEEQSDPNVRTFPLADLDTVEAQTVAIGVASAGDSDTVTRVLSGSVADPDFGDARAIAYLDFIRPTLDGDPTGSDVTEVWLELDRTYAYGDTTATLPYDLRPIQGTWDADTDYPADTLLAVGDVLSTTSVTNADSLKRFDVPESWTRANADLLVGDDFVDGFEGFALQLAESFVPSPGAVFGFNTLSTTGSGLRVVITNDSEVDTVVFPLSEVFSSISTSAPAVVPSTYLPVRANTGAGIGFTVDLASVGVVPVANARVRLPFDDSFAETGSFVRPTASRAILVGVRLDEDGEEERQGLGDFTIIDGSYVLSDPRQFSALIQSTVLNPDERFDRFEVLPATNPVSFDALPVLLPLDGSPNAPRFTLTVVGVPQ
ncbi:MAG: hypothetical protein AAGK21_02050 [Bacteroidota bacterium]